MELSVKVGISKLGIKTWYIKNRYQNSESKFGIKTRYHKSVSKLGIKSRDFW